jgi:uncharacterized SAM-binding protein YcdF (DUF218 family)
MSDFEVREGTPGLTLEDIAHVVIPGGGRDVSGEDLGTRSYARVLQAADLYTHHDLAERGGRIVCSGYKSPADTKGAVWSPGDSPDEIFTGVPEADAMRRKLISLGIASAVIHVERHSIDTTTNLAHSEAGGYFGDDRPVAIVSHEAHLRRILEVVAPKTLKREFLGVVVPQSGAKDTEGWLPRLASRAILRGITPDTPQIVELTSLRAARVWNLAARMQRLLPQLGSYYE